MADVPAAGIGRRISVVLPAYNEEGNIVEQVKAVDVALRDLQFDEFEILVVDDGSTDRTREVTEALRAEVPQLVVIPHEVNRGYQDWDWDLVESVQGVPLRDFDHLNRLLDEADGPWINISLDDNSRLVIDRVAAQAADEELFDSFGIPGDRWPVSSEGHVASR